MGVTTIGFKEFASKCENLTDELMEEFDDELLEAANNWGELAKQAAPNDQGNLINLIKGDDTVKVISATEHTAEVTSGASYSAFLEWGTKTKVRIPAGLQDYAAQFRGGGQGKGQAKQMIYAWMNRVGVPKQFQWMTFISIIVKGINPHPYFFIQSALIEKDFLEQCQKILNTEH